MLIHTKLGDLIVEESGYTRENYPGFVISLVRDNKRLEMAMVEVDQTENDPVLKVHVWNQKDDDPVFDLAVSKDELDHSPWLDNTRLEMLTAIIEKFEDILDAHSIVLENSDKAQDPDASTIYGLDFGYLCDQLDAVFEEYHFSDSHPLDATAELLGKLRPAIIGIFDGFLAERNIQLIFDREAFLDDVIKTLCNYSLLK